MDTSDLLGRFRQAAPAECINGQYSITGRRSPIRALLHHWLGSDCTVHMVALHGWEYTHFVTIDTGHGKFSMMVM